MVAARFWTASKWSAACFIMRATMRSCTPRMMRPKIRDPMRAITRITITRIRLKIYGKNTSIDGSFIQFILQSIALSGLPEWLA